MRRFRTYSVIKWALNILLDARKINYQIFLSFPPTFFQNPILHISKISGFLWMDAGRKGHKYCVFQNSAIDISILCLHRRIMHCVKIWSLFHTFKSIVKLVKGVFRHPASFCAILGRSFWYVGKVQEWIRRENYTMFGHLNQNLSNCMVHAATLNIYRGVKYYSRAALGFWKISRKIWLRNMAHSLPARNTGLDVTEWDKQWVLLARLLIT